MHILLATSTSENKKMYTKKKIETYLADNGIDLQSLVFSTENIYTATKDTLQKADLVVCIGNIPKGLSVDVVDGTAFAARIPSLEDITCKKILAYVKKLA